VRTQESGAAVEQPLQQHVEQLEQELQSFRAELEQLRHDCLRSRQVEARYRQIFENAPISMLSINPQGYITEMNQAAEQLYGLSIEQLNQQAGSIFENAQLVENGTLPYMRRALAGETVIEQPSCYDSSRDNSAGKTGFGKGHYFPIWEEGQVREIIEIAPDCSDWFAAQEAAAQERAKLLGSIAQVANLLLKSSDYTTVLPDVVRLLGEAVESDRCSIAQDVWRPTSEQIAVTVLSDWCKPGDKQIQTVAPELAAGLMGDWIEFHQQFLQGEVLNSQIADLAEPMRSRFAAQAITSILIVPIMVQGKCWGNIGFDNCGEPRLYDEAEIAILKVAADSLAAAIERQQKDKVLRQSEARYRTLFEISSEGFYQFEYDSPIPLTLPVDEQVKLMYQRGHYPRINATLAAMYGLDHLENNNGFRLADLHAEELAENQIFMRALVENRHQVHNYESEEDDRYGNPRYYLNNIVTIIENNCAIGGWASQLDITELRLAQQALLEAEQERTKLLTTITFVANQLLRAADYTMVLPDVLQILGEAAHADRYSLIQNIVDPQTGKPAIQMHTEWCREGIQPSIVHTPDLETALTWEVFSEGYQRLLQGEILSFNVDELTEPTLSIVLEQGNIAMLIVPISVAGQFWGVFGFDYCQEARSLDPAMTGIFAIAVDSITAAIERQQRDETLRQSEERYRTLFELSSEGIYRVEFEQPIPLDLPVEQQVELQYRYFRVVETNSAFAQLYGFDSPAAVTNLRLTDIHVEDSEQNLAFMRTLIENGGNIQNYESEEIDRHGNRLYLLNNITSDVRGGHIWGNWGTCINITQLRQAQQALLQAEQARAQQLKDSNQVLQLREQWLEATANAANALLSIPDLDEAINTALRIIGEGIAVDRVCVFQHFDDPNHQDSGFVQVLYEWDSPEIISQLNHPEHSEIPWEGMEDWLAQVKSGDWIGGIVNELPEPFRSSQTELEVKSTYAVPIFVEGLFWGAMGIDCCREARQLTLPEISVFKTAAACIGSAIERDRHQQQREAAILDERSRMAREIHDTIAQGLTGIVVQLQAAEDPQTTSDDRNTHIQTARQLAKASLVEARRSVWALRPQALEDNNLSGALNRLLDQSASSTGISIHRQIQTVAYPLSPQVEDHLLRIVQEVVTNVLKHAQAQQIWVYLAFTPTQIQLHIRDDGQGFTPEAVTQGFGLTSIRERAQHIQATLTLTSQPGQGTTVDVIVPTLQPGALP
jgi:PAS domain S-box-containing protein